MNNGKKTPDNALRDKLMALRERLYIRYGERGLKIISVAIPVALALLIILTVALFLFSVRGIEVSGEVTVFNEADVIEAAELEEGDSLFLRSSGSIKRTIKRNLPLAESVKVSKTLTGKVKIKVEFAPVMLYTKIGESYYAIDGDLKVLDKDESRSKYSASGAVYVRLPEVRQPVIGKKLVFYDTVEETDTEGELLYEVKETKYYDYVTEYLKSFLESGFHSDANVIVLEEKFNIELIYAAKFRVRFGYTSDLAVKFDVLFEILNEGSMQSYEKVTVDLTNPSKATARPDNLLDIEEYFK